MKIKQKTVADKVHDLLAKESNQNSDESTEETTIPRITDFDDDEYELPQAQTTEFRKRNVKLLSDQSAKYKGKISSRQEFEEDENDDDIAEESDNASDFYEASDSEEAEVEEEEDNEVMAEFGKKLSLMQNLQAKNVKKHKADNDDDESQNDTEADEEESDEDDNDDDEEEEEENEDINKTKIVSETNRQMEMQKGVCVQNQLRIWERLLELRIQSQKIITKANQLPAPEVFNNVPNIEEVKSETVQNVNNLLHKLLDLQNTLKSQYTEMHSQAQKRANTNRDDNDVDEPSSKRVGIELEQNFQTFREYRNNVLLKWDDRTKLMTPGSGNKRKSAQEDFDILKKITHAMSSRKMLIERSQTIKPAKEMATAETVVEDKESKKCEHIYDDSDFYHQQLRELIEYKANTTSNMSEVTRQYVELQKLRQKMKKKVDTRASKGRKIRYVVHNKLVNFMAPEDTSTWTDQSKDELYKSLFAA